MTASSTSEDIYALFIRARRGAMRIQAIAGFFELCTGGLALIGMVPAASGVVGWLPLSVFLVAVATLGLRYYGDQMWSFAYACKEALTESEARGQMLPNRTWIALEASTPYGAVVVGAGFRMLPLTNYYSFGSETNYERRLALALCESALYTHRQLRLSGVVYFVLSTLGFIAVFVAIYGAVAVEWGGATKNSFLEFVLGLVAVHLVIRWLDKARLAFRTGEAIRNIYVALVAFLEGRPDSSANVDRLVASYYAERRAGPPAPRWSYRLLRTRLGQVWQKHLVVFESVTHTTLTQQSQGKSACANKAVPS